MDKEKILKESKEELEEEKLIKIKELIKIRLIELEDNTKDSKKIQKEIDLLLNGKNIIIDGDTVHARDWNNMRLI